MNKQSIFTLLFVTFLSTTSSAQSLPEGFKRNSALDRQACAQKLSSFANQQFQMEKAFADKVWAEGYFDYAAKSYDEASANLRVYQALGKLLKLSPDDMLDETMYKIGKTLQTAWAKQLHDKKFDENGPCGQNDEDCNLIYDWFPMFMEPTPHVHLESRGLLSPTQVYDGGEVLAQGIRWISFELKLLTAKECGSLIDVIDLTFFSSVIRDLFWKINNEVYVFEKAKKQSESETQAKIVNGKRVRTQKEMSNRIASGKLKPSTNKIKFCVRNRLSETVEVESTYNAIVKNYEYKGETRSDTTWINGARPPWTKQKQ